MCLHFSKVLVTRCCICCAYRQKPKRLYLGFLGEKNEKLLILFNVENEIRDGFSFTKDFSLENKSHQMHKTFSRLCTPKPKLLPNIFIKKNNNNPKHLFKMHFLVSGNLNSPTEAAATASSSFFFFFFSGPPAVSSLLCTNEHDLIMCQRQCGEG